MKYVEIYRLGADYKQSIAAICTLGDDNIVSCSGDPDLVSSLQSDGVMNEMRKAGQPKTYLPSDGIKFLEQLKYYLKSGYLNASEVLEK